MAWPLPQFPTNGILMMDILLASINRLKYDYEEAALKPYHEIDDVEF